jgi:hypothetical protein
MSKAIQTQHFREKPSAHEIIIAPICIVSCSFLYSSDNANHAYIASAGQWLALWYRAKYHWLSSTTVASWFLFRKVTQIRKQLSLQGNVYPPKLL